MTARHHCGTALRRQRVSDSTVTDARNLELNGIDFLEVRDNDAPAGMRQRLLDVTFLKDAGVSEMMAVNCTITGGSRITGIKVIEAAQISSKVLRLEVDQAGDFSPYRLTIATSPENPVPMTFLDSQLDGVDFSFKVECPSDFDCVDDRRDEPVHRDGPPIDYLTRDFAGFRQLMLDRMSSTMPGWTERNPADLGVTMVEVVADAADKISWMQDVVQTEAFFERTRFRQSLTRHARLLGYHVGEGQNARTAVAITADLDRAPTDPVISVGTRFLTPRARPGPPVPTVLPRKADDVQPLIDAGARVFEAIEPLASLKVARNRIALHNWGDKGCCLLPGATEAVLVGKPEDLDLSHGDLLTLEERVPFGGNADDPPDPTHRQLIRLSADPVAAFDPIMDRHLSRVIWAAEDALRFALPLDDLDGLSSTVARGNIVLVDEGRTVDYAVKGAAAGEDEIATGDLNQTGVAPDDGIGRVPRLKVLVSPLVYAVPHDPTAARTLSAAAALTPSARAIAAVRLRRAGEDWIAVPQLLGSDRFAPHFMVEPGHDEITSYVRFGDGVLGRAPGNLNDFVASIRHGGGLRGNVGAGAIAHVVTQDGTGIAAVTNPIPALGGRAREDRRAVQTAAPQAFRTPRRAVTPRDYAAVAAQHPRVARAFGRRRWTGSWYTITLALDLVGGGSIDSATAAEVRDFIESQRLAGHDLDIVSPIFVPLDIVLFACVDPAHDAADLHRDLQSLFSDRVQLDGSLGVFHPDALEFGEDLALSPLIARAISLDGLSWIGVRDRDGAPVGRFGRLDQPNVDFASTGTIPIAGGEIARLDNDRNRPEMGRIRFQVEGGR